MTSIQDRRVYGFGAVLLILTLAAGVQTVWASQRDARLTTCLTSYATAQAESLDRSVVPLATSQLALDRVLAEMRSVITPGPPTAADERQIRELRAAVSDYLMTRQEVINELRRNPLPPPPREVC